jgi:hypothetical protein
MWLVLITVTALDRGMAASNPAVARPFSPTMLRAVTTPVGTMSTTGRLRNDKVLVPVNEKFGARQVQVAVREGGQMRVTPNSIERSAGQTNLALEKGKLSFVKFTDRSAEKLGTSKVYLEGTAILPVSATQVFSAKLFMLLGQKTMRWNPKSSAYTNELIIGIEADSPEIAARLASQTVLLTDADVELQSSRVQIDQPGRSGSRSVGMSLATYQSTGAVTAVSDFGEARILIPVEHFGVGNTLALILPGPLLVIAVVGGAIGGLLRSAQKKFKRLPWLICEGILVAIVIVAALSAGFQLGQVGSNMVAKAVGVFAVAAISGFVGAILLDKLAKQFTSAKKEE